MIFLIKMGRKQKREAERLRADDKLEIEIKSKVEDITENYYYNKDDPEIAPDRYDEYFEIYMNLKDYLEHNMLRIGNAIDINDIIEFLEN